MNKQGFCSTLLPLVIITAGGLLALGICYLLLLLTNNLLESRLFSTNPTETPVFLIRRVIALMLLVLYLALLLTKLPDLVKATVLVGPLGFLTTTAILTFYQKPLWAIAATVFIAAISTTLIFRSKKPWYYYYAVGITILISILLAWPRA